MRLVILLGGVLAVAAGWFLAAYPLTPPLPLGEDPRRVEYRWH